MFMNNQGATINDSDFIPRRMLNAVERLVTAARDMEQIRRGKDVFKIVYLVTCIETLQLLKKTATDVNGSATSKKELEDIFVRTCIHFIRSYVIEYNMRQASDE